MALTDEGGSGIPATMLVGPANIGGGTYPYPVYPQGNNGNNDGFGDGNGWWIVLLIILLAAGNGFGNNNGGGDAFSGQPIIVNDGNSNGYAIQRGFDQASIMSGITGVQSGVQNLSTQLCNCCGDIQTSLCNGFAGVNATVNSGFSQAEIANNARQIANMQQAFAAQTAVTQGMNDLAMGLQNCCCENRAATADLKYTVATENCADRQAISDGIRDILTATQAQTTTILNQLCADKLEAKNDTIAQLRSELMYARGQASQDVQTAAIQAGQRALANEVEQYVAPKAIPAYVVQNPNCCVQNTCGCGCGSF